MSRSCPYVFRTALYMDCVRFILRIFLFYDTFPLIKEKIYQIREGIVIHLQYFLHDIFFHQIQSPPGCKISAFSISEVRIRHKGYRLSVTDKDKIISKYWQTRKKRIMYEIPKAQLSETKDCFREECMGHVLQDSLLLSVPVLLYDYGLDLSGCI